MKTKIISVLMLVVMGFALLGGCAAPDDGGQGAPLEDTRWVLQGYGTPGDLTVPVGDREAFMVFKADGSFTGSTGCNSYFGGYQLDGNQISVSGPVGQTEMACQGVMDQEMAYMQLLQAMESYQIEGSQLTLTGADGVLVYRAEVSGGGQGAGYTCDEFGQNNHVSQDITLAVGDTFELTLCANPTTGYQWGESEISDASVLAQKSREYRAPSSDMAGAPGAEDFVFKALKAGSGSVKIDYGQPWEGGQKGAWSYTLNYTVK